MAWPRRTEDDVSATVSWLDDALAPVHLADGHTRLAVGAPQVEDGGWAWFDDHADPAVQDLVLARQQARANGPIDTPLTVRGAYIWQNLVGPAPRLAGDLFVRQRLMPPLHANVMVHNIAWMQYQRLARSPAVVLPLDPLVGVPGHRGRLRPHRRFGSATGACSD